MQILIAGLVVFFAAHTTQIFGLKEGLVRRFGQNGYRALHSVVSIIGLGLMIWGYGDARAAGPGILYGPPVWARHITIVLMMFASVLLVASLIPCRIKAVTKHPMLASVKIWAFAHLIANGDVASIALFGSFLVWAVIARISARRRPVDVIAMEKARGAPPANDVIVVVLGATLYVAFAYWLHPWLIGVQVM